MPTDCGPYDDVIIDLAGKDRDSEFGPASGAGLGPLPGHGPAGDSGLIPDSRQDREHVFRGGELRSLIDRFLKQVDELERAMTSLPAEQREAVALRVYGGMPFAEIALQQGTSEKTAQSRYRYGIEKIRRILARGVR